MTGPAMQRAAREVAPVLRAAAEEIRRRKREEAERDETASPTTAA